MNPAPHAAALLALGLLAGRGPAQDLDELREKRAAKLSAAFLEKADWLTGFEEAMALAKQSNRPILAYFTRSYAP